MNVNGRGSQYTVFRLSVLKLLIAIIVCLFLLKDINSNFIAVVAKYPSKPSNTTLNLIREHFKYSLDIINLVFNFSLL